MSLAKPQPRERAKPTRPMPRCACRHGQRQHVPVSSTGNPVTRWMGCLICPMGKCDSYRAPSVSVRRSPIQRASAPIKRKCACTHDRDAHIGNGGVCARPKCKCLKYEPAPIKRKTMRLTKCKNCAHPAAKHNLTTGAFFDQPALCQRCAACQGYEPARGIRQKRRTPQAAIRRFADDLWSRLVKTSPSPDAWMAFKGCEVQRFYPHACEMGLQAMHGIPRTFSATRWLPINGFAGCAGIHKFFTDRPEMWSAVLLDAWGEPTFRELWALARASQPVDMDATVASLRAELARMEGE